MGWEGNHLVMGKTRRLFGMADRDVKSRIADHATKQDKYLRSVAEFRNLQERTKREVSAAKDFAIQRFARDLVESVDNLDRALQNVPADKLSAPDANKDLVNLADGTELLAIDRNVEDEGEETAVKVSETGTLDIVDPRPGGVSASDNEDEPADAGDADEGDEE